MEDVFVAQLMTAEPHTVTPDTLVEEAARVMLEADVGSVIVVDDDNRLAGILTTTDFVRVAAEGTPPDRTPVSASMTADVVTADPQDTVRDVADAMMEHGFHHVPVVDETGGVVGILTTTDLAAYLSHDQTPSRP